MNYQKSLEICVDNIESAILAEKGGADRIELCSSLDVGGLTPSLGLLKLVKSKLTIPVFMMIRPRSGSFNYTSLELSQMVEDIRTGLFVGVDGFVTGALKNKTVDLEACYRLKKEARDLPVTFHRAFDLCEDKVLEDIIGLGFSRILTSGHETTAYLGKENIKQLRQKAGSRITIMPGCGITPINIFEISQVTEAVEYHSSGRSPTKDVTHCSVVGGTMSYHRVDINVVKSMKAALNGEVPESLLMTSGLIAQREAMVIW